MKPHPLPSAVTCPACAAELVGVLNMSGDEKPTAGDPTLCFTCRALLIYCGSPINSLRYPTSEEQRRFLANSDVQHAIAALAEAHRRGIFR